MTTHVADRLLDEGLERLAPLLRRLKVRVSAFTAIRWILDGADGVRLEGLKVGGAWHSTEGAVRRFLRARADEQGREAQRDRSGEREVARKKLKARGLRAAKA